MFRVLLTRELVICTVVSIPTEYKFTRTLWRSLEIFASSVFVATVRGILNTFADVWNEPHELLRNPWCTMLTQCWNACAYTNVIGAWNVMCKILPWQMCPSLVNPGLQEQLNDPAVFEQVALSLLQLWVSLADSLMSELESTHCTHDNDYENLSWRGKGEKGLQYMTIVCIMTLSRPVA